MSEGILYFAEFLISLVAFVWICATFLLYVKRQSEKEKVSVSRESLHYLTSFECQHVMEPGDKRCDETDRGGLCNSCWVRRWAEDQLKN